MFNDISVPIGTLDEWKLTPFFTYEYKALIQTLKNSGLVEGDNFFGFYYDWRQPVRSIGKQLLDFLNDHSGDNPSQKFNIISHSLGGLVARSCIEYEVGCAERVNKVITAGTPHFGVVDAYYLINNVVPGKDPLEKSVEQIILNSTKTNIRDSVLSIQDILPVFSYINWHSYSQMAVLDKNPFLENLPLTKSQGLMTTFSGILHNKTSEKLFIKPPYPATFENNLWLDGRPFKTSYGTGDDTVLDSSATLLNLPNFKYATWHSGLIGTLEPEKEILTQFNLPTDKQIKVAKQKNNWDALFFLKKNPENLTFSLQAVSGPSIKCLDKENRKINYTYADEYLMVIENPPLGSCKISYPKNNGLFVPLLAGYVSQNYNDWQIIGVTAKNKPAHKYNLNYHKNKPLDLSDDDD